MRDFSVRPVRRRPPRLGDSIAGSRMWIYAVVLLAALGLRFVPGIWPEVKAPTPKPQGPETLVVSGLDLAPNLIPQLIEEYRTTYPWVQPTLRPGGTRQALEDLLNRRADLAVLSRVPTAEEASLISSIGDSVATYAVAIGGIAVLSSTDGGLDSVSAVTLRSWVRGEPDASGRPAPTIYAPDPNLGLWEALALCLGVTAPEPPPGVRWLADERAVAQAAGADRGAIGFASTLALPAKLGEFAARMIPVRADTSARAADPYRGQIARGDYPLFHYLYFAVLPQPESAASKFVTYVFGNRGQRLVRRQGFVPARQTARLIQLASRPLG